jgi:type II secretory pathway component PulF
MVPSLRDIANGYRKTISRQIKLFTDVISGVVLGAVFIFVGFIAFSIVMAVFQVSNSLKIG